MVTLKCRNPRCGVRFDAEPPVTCEECGWVLTEADIAGAER